MAQHIVRHSLSGGRGRIHNEHSANEFIPEAFLPILDRVEFLGSHQHPVVLATKLPGNVGNNHNLPP
ncbi:MAG: hypothetical protein KY475_15725 [Planctomycetes bacterium]|nr:hypothetical protein [Planctomycetota bacterium]